MTRKYTGGVYAELKQIAVHIVLELAEDICSGPTLLGVCSDSSMPTASGLDVLAVQRLSKTLDLQHTYLSTTVVFMIQAEVHQY